MFREADGKNKGSHRRNDAPYEYARLMEVVRTGEWHCIRPRAFCPPHPPELRAPLANSRPRQFHPPLLQVFTSRLRPPLPRDLRGATMDLQQEKARDKEQRILKQRVEVLEKENMALKKSLYELSTRYNMVAHKAQPFSIDSLEALEPGTSMAAELGKPGGAEDADLFGTAPPNKHKDRRQFYLKHELKGHEGAVYAVKFSPCGKFLATGSFDKKSTEMNRQRELRMTLEEHEAAGYRSREN
ncbi:hypothetical protein BDK51DRAFT_46191 [Blyttiomyces helicus]|uniref:WD40-repeat-containing domain protein n=1 Tax=Blyttiomyces helicus TaxID=388810 RepID=A0A4P9WC23_9FUNG|nr:hypothetical protein BDK51DRAFT_46191 [Blyttiomyces helicus]|eukprot:RKO88738.1 hypothetical protein BDK51DRAFT_46191 [Blyttiomyces helicus]